MDSFRNKAHSSGSGNTGSRAVPETGIKPVDTEQRRIAFVQYAFGIIGVFILTAMVILTVRDGRLLYALLTLLATAVIFSTVVFLRVTGRTGPTSCAFSIVIAGLSIGLLCTGGIHNNGPMWIFIFPPLLYYMTGIRWGSLTVLIIFAVSLLVLFVPQWPFLYTEYNEYFRIRFVLAFICVGLISFAMEWSRFRLHRATLTYARKLEQISVTDPLTGVNNRRGGLDRIAFLSAMSQRNLKPFSLMLMDLDYFKQVNDEWGHDCGDLVLKQTAELLKKTVRRQDIVIRWGGEEFLVVLPETDITMAVALAERIRGKLKGLTIDYKGTSVNVTASIGVAQGGPEKAIEASIEKADLALYRAKEAGRDQVMQES